jgi:endonuclease G
MSLSGTVRFEIRKLGGGRLNIDNISISDYVVSTFPDNDNYLTMGNPSGAVTNVNLANNYLLVKTAFAMSYNNSRGSCNWVSWRVGSTDLGNVPRCDCFKQDTQLPSTFYRATSTSYSGTGFDRGHQCPSADRDASSTANAATFLMSNMLPQAPNLNQITWENLETYCRTLVSAGNELYIVCGGYGQGGSGSNGGTTSVIAGGSITVPSRCWKVIVVLPNGSNDVSRVSTSTRVIAVDMPNNQSVNSLSWGSYRTTVDAIETATGYNLLPNLPASVQNTLEAAVDNGPTQ